jgi:predicted amidohydrolase
MRSLKLAAFQRRPLYDNVEGIVQRICADLTWCAEECLDLALFPECYLQGYAEDRPTISRRAFSLDGPEFAEFCDRIAHFPTTVVLGLMEKRDRALHNSAVVIARGVLQGVYAKTHPNEPGFDPGSEYPVFQRGDCCFGVNICYDANFAEPAMILREQGAALIAFPLNNMMRSERAAKVRPLSIQNLKDRAMETGCWIASADVVGEDGQRMSYGCTCIVNPAGEMVSQAPEHAEGAAVFELDDFNV